MGGVFWLSYLTALAAVTLSQLSQPRRNRPSIRIAFPDHYSLASQWLLTSADKLDLPHWKKYFGCPGTAQHRPAQKVDLQRAPGILRQLREETNPHWGTDIVWPEAAVPAIPQRVNKFLDEINLQAKVNQTALLTGIPTYDPGNQRYYNSVIALGAAQGQYDKTRLVPFGEYVPVESLLRGLIRFLICLCHRFPWCRRPATAGCCRSKSCYGNLLRDCLSRSGGRNGQREATALLTVSNDAWFGNSIAPQQHMQMARMRALENAKPMMRGTSTGVTALVDHRGEITATIEQFRAGVLTGNIAPAVGRHYFHRPAHGRW